jgi:predicted nuclease of predicted toxin-antitoxin system
VVLDLAVAEGRVIVTADTDFGGLLVLRQLRRPPTIQFRRGAPRRPAQQAAVLVANLPATDDLTHGAIVTIRGDRLRVRRLS